MPPINQPRMGNSVWDPSGFFPERIQRTREPPLNSNLPSWINSGQRLLIRGAHGLVSGGSPTPTLVGTVTARKEMRATGSLPIDARQQPISGPHLET
jgi:hypothetical protein